MKFNSFNPSSLENFRAMLGAFQFPFVYDKKTLYKNRCDFKDYFSYLTNIRVAVIEGGLCLEAACWILQGYVLGETIPLESFDPNIPQSSTINKQIGIHVYNR